ncbi:MAG: DUF1592 domain-containing protein [Polyangiales bacterium]
MRGSQKGAWMWGSVVALTVCVGAAVGCGKGNVGGHDESAPIDPTLPKPELLVDSTSFPRLTHRQWENTVQDLLHLDKPLGLSADFTTDPPGSTFANDSQVLQMTPGLFTDEAEACETIAEKLATDSAMRAKILPKDLTGDAKAKATAFVKEFGRHAFRRPLSAAETDQFVTFFLAAAPITGDADPFIAGVRLTVQAMLQSPAFVYRMEVGEISSDGTRHLTAWEIASKLSYALWNSMPDEALFKTAEDGSILTPEVLEAQARRLLGDPRAKPMIDDFHETLLHLGPLDVMNGASKDATKFPDWTETTPASMKQETLLFAGDVVLTRGGTLGDLLTSNETFINGDLAKIYGVDGITGTTMQKVKLDPTQRAGILTQGSFLATNAGRLDTDPIHRGVFTNLNVICSDLPPPPMATIPPIPDDPTGKTMRQRVTEHTGAGTCGAGCHGTMINPMGFAFETFDAIGKWRTTDNGKPIDAHDVYDFIDVPRQKTPITFDGPVALAKILAVRPQVHQCYTGKWLEYAYGRRLVDDDDGLVERIAKVSLAGASVKDVIVELVLAPSFSQRPKGGS